MNNTISRDKVILFCMVIAIVVLMWVIVCLQEKTDKLQEQLVIDPGKEITTGQYTIIHYAPGWTNAIYITEYYYEGDFIHYLEKGSTKYKQLWAPDILPVDGWIDEGKLMDYGYWVPDDIGLGE